MTDIDRIIRQIHGDPWTARVFLAFTVGMFLSCSAEFAAGQDGLDATVGSTSARSADTGMPPRAVMESIR